MILISTSVFIPFYAQFLNHTNTRTPVTKPCTITSLSNLGKNARITAKFIIFAKTSHVVSCEW